MWQVMDDQTRLFSFGREAYSVAAEAANTCSAFLADEEDEWAADEERSCYNCRYRRWTQESFVCMASLVIDNLCEINSK